MKSLDLISELILELERLETCAEPYGGCSPDEKLVDRAKKFLVDFKNNPDSL